MTGIQPDPLGGIIRRDGHGNPNGVLEEPPGDESRCRVAPKLPRKTGCAAS